MNLFLTSEDSAIVADLLAKEGVEAAPVEQKSGLQEAQMLVIALGGGVGIAAIIRAIGFSLEKYFRGQAVLERARRITIRLGDKIIQLRSSDDLQKLGSLIDLDPES